MKPERKMLSFAYFSYERKRMYRMQRSFQKNVKKCKERSINFKRTLKNAAFFLKEHKNLAFFEKNACPTLNFVLQKVVIFISLGARVCRQTRG